MNHVNTTELRAWYDQDPMNWRVPRYRDIIDLMDALDAARAELDRREPAPDTITGMPSYMRQVARAEAAEAARDAARYMSKTHLNRAEAAETRIAELETQATTMAEQVHALHADCADKRARATAAETRIAEALDFIADMTGPTAVAVRKALR